MDLKLKFVQITILSLSKLLVLLAELTKFFFATLKTSNTL